MSADDIADCDHAAKRHMVWNEPDDVSDRRVRQLTLEFLHATRRLDVDAIEAVTACINVMATAFTGSDCRGCRSNMRNILRSAMEGIFEVLDLPSFDDVRQ